MTLFLKLAVLCWFVWVLAHVVLMLAVRRDAPHCNGVGIYIPDWVHARLTAEEAAAVYQHERGHMHHAHVWKNLAMVCAFRYPSKARRYAQEIEADDYAFDRGCGDAFASALRKLGRSAVDGVRARRLELKGLVHRATPAARDDAADDKEKS